MEPAEREKIRSNLTDLVLLTNCNTEFLMFFYSKKILTMADIEMIASKNAGIDRASEFYKIITTRQNAFHVLIEALHQLHQNKALQVLVGEEEVKLTLAEVEARVAKLLREQPSMSNITFDILPPVDLFTGRTKELNELHEMILRSKDKGRVTVISQLTTIAGLGGIGKTELARQYIQNKGSEFFGNVLWLNGESENSLADSFRRLATETLGLSTKDGNGQEKSLKGISEDVCNFFEGTKALFVFDNADKTPWLKEYLPKSTKTRRFFSLITSRNSEWDRDLKVLTLEVLLIDEAISMVKKGLKIVDTNSSQEMDILKLVEYLQCFPLALQQAIAYIYDQQRQNKDCFPISEYLRQFEAKQIELLSFRDEISFNDIYSFTTNTTWHITMDKIRAHPHLGRLSNNLMSIISYLSPNNIKRNLFYAFPSPIQSLKSSNEEYDKKTINSAVRLLVKYSMLSGREGQAILSVHRLVQSVTKDQLAKEHQEETILEEAIELLEGNKKDGFPVENISHALVVYSHAWKYNQVVLNHSWKVCEILWKINHAGFHSEGLQFGSEALDTLKKVIGEDHLHSLTLQLRIALILRDQGNFDKSQAILEYILPKANAQMGETSQLSLAITNELGNVLRRKGKYNEAADIFKHALERVNGETEQNLSDIMAIENNYGLALMDGGRVDEALKIFQKLLNIHYKNEQENRYEIMLLEGYSATIHQQKGDYEEALKFRRKIFDDLCPIWSEHVDFFAMTCSSLGDVQNILGEHEQSLLFLEENFKKIEERLGRNHLRTLEMQAIIAKSYEGLKDFEKAKEILQNVEEGSIELFGEESLKVLNVKNNMANVLLAAEEFDQAICIFQNILPKLEAITSGNSVSLAMTKWSYAKAIAGSKPDLKMSLELMSDAKMSLIALLGEKCPIVNFIDDDIEEIQNWSILSISQLEVIE